MRLSEEREAVDRLYHSLADALRRSRVEPFSSPVTVAEIYQELVPYRQVREELGFGMNADYEHALLCLLAGDGDHVRLEPDSARNAIAKELKTPNPNVSIYREYAGCDAWVAEPVAGATADTNADANGEAEETDDSALDWLEELDEEELGAAVGTFAFLEDEENEDGAATPKLEPAGEGAAADVDVDALVEDAWGEAWSDAEPEVEPAASPDAEAAFEPEPALEATPEPVAAPKPAPATEPVGQDAQEQDRQPVRSEAGVNGSSVRVAAANAQSEGDRATKAAPHCLFCDSTLPGGRVVKFCPFCGSDQSKRPCPSCDEVLDEGWVFCIACGSSADG